MKPHITKEIALTLKHGQYLYHINNLAGRVRVNGKVKTWKTRPNDFKIPVKRGLYEYGYISNIETEHNNHIEWSTEESK